MALSACIPDLVAAGRIPPGKAEDITALYEDLLRQYEGRYGRAAAESMATTQALKTLESTYLHRKRHVLYQAKAQQGILANANGYDGGKAGKPTMAAMLANLVRDERAPYANVEYRMRAIKQNALGGIYDILVNHRAGLTGTLRNKADLDLIVRELHGDKTGDVNAMELADAWRQTGETLRQRFNAAGGHIGKIEGWGLPHSHDSRAVGLATPEEWIDFVMPRLDRNRMVDDSTLLPFSDEKLRLVLHDVYESIRTEGWSKRSPGGMGGKSTGNRNAEHRFLHFADGESWMAYQDRFGGADAYSAMLDHIDFMARDIAMMEILGPNPAATVQWMKDVVTKEAKTGTRESSAAGDLAEKTIARLFGDDRARELRAMGSAAGQIDLVFNEIIGANKARSGRNLALFGSSLRNWQTATKLGSAAITSFSDVGTAALTRRFNGLPATTVMNGYMKQLNPLDAGDREFARRTGLIGDEFAVRVGHGGRMHLDETFGGFTDPRNGAIPNGLERSAEVTRRMADGTLRVSGLNAWTDAGRQAMGMEFYNAITQFADTDFAGLAAPFQKFLGRYGIGADGWDVIRASPKESWNGAEWITPNSIADKGLRDRLGEAILTEIDFAVPTGGLKQRALVNAVPAGTLVGEFIRTGFQFKMFPLTVMHMHGQRMLAQSNLANKALYTVAFLGATTLTGALAEQMTEFFKGKNPRPMMDGDFWKRAMLKGGGIGIYGDILQSAESEYGQEFDDIISGPSWATVQNVNDFAKTGDIAKFLKRETPGGNIWYIRAAYERLLIDTVAEWQDGERAADQYDRVLKRAEDEGGSFFAPPGAGLSGLQTPDFSTALDEAPPDDE